MEPVPLRKLLSSSEIAALLEDLAKITPDAVRLWVVDAEGDLIACYPQEGEGIGKEFASIIEEVHQVAKTIRFPRGVALPIVVEGRLLGVLVGEGVGSELSEPSAAFEHLGRVLTLLATKELEKRATAQALAQRVEELSTTAEIVHELTAASLDLERVIDLMLDRAMQATGADYGVVALHDEEKGGLLLLAQRGYPPGALEPYRYEPWPVERGVVGRVVKTGTVALLPDVSQDPDYAGIVEQARSQLAVPIIREGEVVGVLSLESSELAGFSERDAGFVSHLAGHAAIAIENARLYENVTEKMREAMALHRVGGKLMRTLNVDQLLEEILEVLERSFGYLGCAVLLVDEATGELYIKASRGYPQEVVERTRIKIGEEGITGWVAAHKVPLNVPDVAEDPRYVEGVKGTRSEMAVPMLSGEKVIGVLDAQSPKVNAFNEDNLRILSSVAAQATIAIEKARLFEQVAEGRNKLQAILNSTRDGILMLDTTGQIVMINPMIERLWNLKRAEVMGLDLAQLIEEDPHGLLAKLGYSQEQMRGLLQQLQEGEQKVSKVVYEIATPGRRSIERVGAPVLDERGRAIGRVIILHDITEEKELERMREDLTRMIVHDLRSPLTGVIGGLHLLRKAIENPSSQVEMLLDIATSSSQRMLELVNSLLDISQLEAGQMRLEIKARSLPDLIDGARERVAPLALENGIALQVDLPPELPQVAVDEDLVTRVLVNLLDNAIKFSPQGGAVRVTTDGVSATPTFEESSEITSQHYISVSVTDMGPGIPEEYREKIFEKFIQIEEQESRRGRGSGLGLTFCKLVVEAHGGRIWVESHVDQGSTFTFTLPVA